MDYSGLKAQQKKIKTDIDNAINAVLASGNYINGNEVSALEKKLKDYTGAPHVITCANGTDAIQLALMALGIGPGDAVLTSSFSFIGTAEPVALLGATPVFCDINPRTLNICPESLTENIEHTIRKNKLTPKAIISVDIFGSPCDHVGIQKIAEQYNLIHISDAAQSFGGEYLGAKVGNIADITTTSFFPAKPLGCFGDGGAVFTKNYELANICSSIKNHGKGKHKYDHVRIGMNSRLDSIQAAVLAVKLENIDQERAQRNTHREIYNNALRQPNYAQEILGNAVSAVAQYSIITSAEAREENLAKLNSEGIPTQIYYPKPLNHFKIWKEYDSLPTPVSHDISTRIFSIPSHAYLSKDSINKITLALSKIN